VTPPAGSTPKAAPAPVAPAAPTPSPPAASSDAPLPQFSLDSGLHHPPGSDSPRPISSARAADPDTVPRPPQSRRESIRAALDEADFFESRGLYQDASMILRDRLEQYPGEGALIEAIARIEPKLNTESGTRDVGRLSDQSPNDPSLAAPPEVAAPPSLVAPPLHGAPPSLAAVEDVPASRGKELRVQFTTDGTTQSGPIIDADADLELIDSLEQPPREQQIDVDEVFAKFKQGVKAQISDNDSATHYDLGVAYKEMGLLADAAREFELASSDPKRECNCLAMMGMMYRERGELDRAAEAYVKALNAAHKTVGQEVSLYYDLGVIYEMKNDPDEAVYYFQRITRRDPGYRDVSQRLKVLLPRSRRFSQPARAINDDKDFDSNFDDLYKPE